MPEPFEQYGDLKLRRDLEEHLQDRRRAIQERLMAAFRYVAPHRDNSGVFSYEFASILRDSCSAFEAICSGLLRNASPPPKPSKRHNMADFRKMLRQEDHQIHEKIVVLAAGYPRDEVCPFFQWAEQCQLHWWNSYNDLKHSEFENVASGTLKAAVSVVAALAILKVQLTRNVTPDGMWVAMTGRLDPDRYKQRLMFHHD